MAEASRSVYGSSPSASRSGSRPPAHSDLGDDGYVMPIARALWDTSPAGVYSWVPGGLVRDAPWTGGPLPSHNRSLHPTAGLDGVSTILPGMPPATFSGQRPHASARTVDNHRLSSFEVGVNKERLPRGKRGHGECRGVDVG